MAKKKLTEKQKKARTRAASKRFTVGKGLDLFSLAGPAIREAAQYAQTGDISTVQQALPKYYTGFNPVTGAFDATAYVKGYGGAVNRVMEKKLFKLLRIKGPPSRVKTVSDAVDLISYFGSAGLAAWTHRLTPGTAVKEVHTILNGVDLGLDGTAAYAPRRMIEEKLIPYVGQKMIFKILRWGGINVNMRIGG